MNLNGLLYYVTFNVRHLPGYANIKSENRNAEKRANCSTSY